MTGLSIGGAAKACGFSADTLRYYEKIGLLPRVVRDAGDRRRYGREDLSPLAFIRRSQRMRFSLEEIRMLLELRRSDRRIRADVLKLADRKLVAIETSLADLIHLKNELKLLINLCRRASGNACPIIEKLDEA
ncbi:MAG: MerR family transcriptional regulator [Rhodanobacteraceae bacterium]